MTTAPPRESPLKSEKLYWIKYNPNEWNGMYSELTDAEYGMFHRVIAKLWSTPGNRLTLENLLVELRLIPGSKRARLVERLLGYALKVDPAGQLFVTAVDDAFADASRRGRAGKAGAEARWEKEKLTPQESQPEKLSSNSEDF